MTQPTHSFNDFFDIDNTISITSGPASGDVYLDTNNMNGSISSLGPYNYSTSIGATGSAGVWSISDSLNVEYQINWPEEWVDSFPDWSRVEQMCSQYPALEIALRNFKTVYALVKDDYDNPKDEK